MWFRGLTQGKEKKGVQLSIFPRKSAVVLWFQATKHTPGVEICYVPSKIGCGFVFLTQGKEKEGVQFDMFSQKSAVVLWFHPGED